jgi:hypothetical protein
MPSPILESISLNRLTKLKFYKTSEDSKVGHGTVMSKISSLSADCMQLSWAALEAPQRF